MNNSIPWYNFSLRKILQSETGSFKIARIKILYTILIISLIKVLYILGVSISTGQDFQENRAWVFLVVYLILFKILLANKSYERAITHFMIWLGLGIIWSNVFMAAHAVNIITLQFVYMAIVSSFYLLNRYCGVAYSIMASLPIILFLSFFSDEPIHLNIVTNEIGHPAGLVMALLNFATIIIVHYLYHRAFSINIKEKEQLNDQLKIAVDDAKRLAQTKSDFLSTMSHELRTPLNSVIGISDLMLENPHNQEQLENLKVLNFSATNLHTLVNNILDFNKLDSDKIYLESLSVNLYDLMQNICSGLQIQATEKGVALNLEIDEKIKDRNIISDPTRITQITYNLIGNGIKFTGKGSVNVSLKVIESSPEMMKVRFAVVDTGVGIHPDKHNVIFEPFIQESASTTRLYGGTGLGLSIVKRLLGLFGSDIQVESTPGSGSKFTFEITFDTDQNNGSMHDAESSMVYNLKGLKVLVGEDNAMNIYLIKKLFQKWNVDYTIAENGQEVLDKMVSGNFDLILLDIHMPLKDGYQTSREIRQMPDPKISGIRIIALTASVADDLNSKIKEAGMDDYLHKPFNAKDLYLKMKNNFRSPFMAKID